MAGMQSGAAITGAQQLRKVGVQPAAPQMAASSGVSQIDANAGVGLDPWGAVIGSEASERNYGRSPAPQRQTVQHTATASADTGVPAPAYAQQSAAPDMTAMLGMLQQLKTAATPAPVVAAPERDNQAGELAFARAKDKAGMLAHSRMRGVRALAGAGGRYDKSVNSILGDASNELTNVALGQAQQEASRGADVVDRNYAGAIQQRGQDLSLVPTLLSLVRSAGRAY